MRLIVLVRDPVKRAYSEYQMKVGWLWINTAQKMLRQNIGVDSNRWKGLGD